MKLNDKVIVITGASQGLGESLAYKVASEGATVLLVARNEAKLQKVKDTIIENNGKAEYFVCDVSDLPSVKKTAQEIFEKHKDVDILVNNVGIWTDDKLEKDHPERRKLAFETNVLGNINVTNEILPHFQEKNAGYIFNVISNSGASDTPAGDNSMWKTYGATKWAMTGFTNALVDSLKGTKIKVTAFQPGGFDSDLYENAGWADPHNQPWMMKMDDIVDIIVFALTRPDDVSMERILVNKVV